VNLTVMGIGWALMGVVVPFYLYRTLVQDRRVPVAAPPEPGLPELQEGDDDLGGRREVIHGDT
jgi:hypothetical protein